ncbi:MAG: type II toxin-antitoxin system MqsA family antitoxin [Candidatus Auribacterota bacterium]|nr:type II toxin-antitoxin system MqsA family antitoxin [Candidatus Auribacterota bacterium]
MKCQICGAVLNDVITDLPFKLGDQTIVILKDLPVKQCTVCSEYLLDDSVMKRVEAILEKVDIASELEVIKYAA